MSDHCTDIIIHIDELLGDEDIHEVERDLIEIPGVYSACVNDRARHLMLVDYDPRGVNSQVLLRAVRGHGLGAELVGL